MQHLGTPAGVTLYSMRGYDLLVGFGPFGLAIVTSLAVVGLLVVAVAVRRRQRAARRRGRGETRR